MPAQVELAARPTRPASPRRLTTDSLALAPILLRRRIAQRMKASCQPGAVATNEPSRPLPTNATQPGVTTALPGPAALPSKEQVAVHQTPWAEGGDEAVTVQVVHGREAKQMSSSTFV